MRECENWHAGNGLSLRPHVTTMLRETELPDLLVVLAGGGSGRSNGARTEKYSAVNR